jgi:hypothetical protein
MFVRAIRYRPTDMPSVGLLAYCMLPEPVREALRFAKRSVRPVASQGGGGKQ